MNNYEYIIAGLPVLSKNADSSREFDASAILDSIRELLDGKDAAMLDLLLKGFDSESLNEDFYRKALASKNSFLRDYFSYDLLVRNTRTAWLNRSLGRPDGMDIVTLNEDEEQDSAMVNEINAVLSQTDILERERGLDSLMWNRIEELNVARVFDLNVILGFAASCRIVDRWLKLDPETGRELFRRLVEEIRSSRTKQ